MLQGLGANDEIKLLSLQCRRLGYIRDKIDTCALVHVDPYVASCVGTQRSRRTVYVTSAQLYYIQPLRADDLKSPSAEIHDPAGHVPSGFSKIACTHMHMRSPSRFSSSFVSKRGYP